LLSRDTTNKTNLTALQAKRRITASQECGCDMGAITQHIGVYGTQDEMPTYEPGLLGQINKTIQLDGTVGRSDDDNLYSLGVKFQF
jgi:hypothetical protein